MMKASPRTRRVGEQIRRELAELIRCVDRDILRRRAECDREGEQRRGERRRRGIRRAEQGDRHREQRLRDQRPGAAASETVAEPRYAYEVERRRPQKLQRVGQAYQREEPDRGLVDAALREPIRQRGCGEQQREAARETHQQDRQHPAVEVDRKGVLQRSPRTHFHEQGVGDTRPGVKCCADCVGDVRCVVCVGRS